MNPRQPVRRRSSSAARRAALLRMLVLGVLAIAVASQSSMTPVAGQVPQIVTDISPEALAQINALLAEKDTRTASERKMDSQLVYARRMELGLPIAPGVQTLEVDVPRADDGHMIVDVIAADTPELRAQLASTSDEVSRSTPFETRVHLAASQLDTLAARGDVVFLRPRQGYMTNRAGERPARRPDRKEARARNLDSVRQALDGFMTNVGSGVGAISTQADITHRTAVFRGLTGATGAGVKIGVLSDGVTNLAAAQASGDLGPVTVLPGQGGMGDEGTAMLELIHDLAPGAELYFATAVNGITSFAQNIRDLRAAGCTIIVDDVLYFVETPFQDGQTPGVVSTTNGGVVIQAVKDVTAGGAMYFSSAGNSGNLNDGTSGVWEGDFTDGGTTGLPPGQSGTVHNFGAQNFDTVTSNSSGPITLYWSDPLGGSANDYDLFLMNPAGTLVIAASTNIQSGTQDPFELVSPAISDERLVVVKKPSAAARMLHLNTNRGELAVATAGQTHGHSSTTAPFSFGVAATPAQGPFPNPFSAANVVETFSSDGPRRILYNGNGTAITPGNVSSTGGVVLNKPDLTAADGGFVSGAGDFPTPFFGTSAAAPHAAAIAAVFKSSNPTLTQQQIKDVMFALAIDIEAAGVDRDSGVGIIMASPAQPGCTFAIASSASVGVGGGNGAANVTASSGSCNWSAWTTVSWITLTSGAVRTGSGAVGYAVAPNPGPVRTGTIVVQGGNSITITQSGTAPTPFDSNAFVALQDPGTIESSLVVSGLAGPISNVTVSLHITHTWDEDLRISLVGPDNTTVNLSTANGADLDNYGSGCAAASRTRFSDSAINYIVTAAPPFVGEFRPEQALAAFNGKSGAAANGTWRLRIQDVVSPDTGALQCWSVNFNVGSSCTYTVNVPFSNAPAGGGAASATVTTSPGCLWNAASNASWLAITSGASGNGSGSVGLGIQPNGTFSTRNATLTIAGQSFPLAQAPVLVPRATSPSFDGDPLADVGIYRHSTGQWFIAQSSGVVRSESWGAPSLGDMPVAGDYDGDGRDDIAVYRRSTGEWFISRSTAGFLHVAWGAPALNDIPVPGDYDGDGKTDIGVYRVNTGDWIIARSSNGTVLSLTWGSPAFGDVPVPADFDGDGRTDVGVFRLVTGEWFVNQSTAGFKTMTWGAPALGDIPVSGDFDGDAKADIGVYRSTTGEWFIARSDGGGILYQAWGVPAQGDIPSPSDFDGDGRMDITVFRLGSGQWFVIPSAGGSIFAPSWGAPAFGNRPLTYR